MNRLVETLEKLENTSEEEWKAIVAKCYGHIAIKLYKKTTSGAHCAQTLGVEPADYYFDKALISLYDGTWKWQFEKYSLAEQLIRIIDSMISEQVRKYKVNITKEKVVLVENEKLANNLDDWISDDDAESDERFMKMNTAIQEAIKDNEKYKEFIYLKTEGFSYNEMCEYFLCDVKDIYQMRETIARRAIKILKSL